MENKTTEQIISAHNKLVSGAGYSESKRQDSLVVMWLKLLDFEERILEARRTFCMEADRRDDDSYCHDKPFCDACEIINFLEKKVEKEKLKEVEK